MRLLQRPADSLVELKQELAVFSGADSHAELVATYRELSQTQVALGELRGAFERHSEFKTISQRLLQRQLDQCFATLKVSFDGETRDKQNRLVVGERDASARALGQAREVGRLRMAVNMLAGALTLVLVLVTIRMRWATATMRALAIADQLTGLRNRRAVLARLRAV